MNPEIMFQIASQQVQDRRARARRDGVARMLAKALRGRRAAAQEPGFVAPAVPDYVDGSFQTAAATQAAVPAARIAA